MTEGLFDRYFRLLAGQLPSAEYGVIADRIDDTTPAPLTCEQEWLCSSGEASSTHD